MTDRRAKEHEPRWALSVLDCKVHLLVPEGDHPPGVLKARCGAVLPLLAAQFTQPPARQCQRYHLILIAAFNACFLTAFNAPTSKKSPASPEYKEKERR